MLQLIKKEMDLLKVAQDALAQEPKEFPNFKAGDTVTVTYVIKEENILSCAGM